jgi:superfamily II DNA or RNA helicase
MEEYKLRKDVSDKLLPYQIAHTENIVRILLKYGRCLDGSDTGTGKTYSSIAVCMQLGLKPFIICPKSVISSWKSALKFFKIKYYGVSNYESLQNCMYYAPKSGVKEICPFIKKIKKKQIDSSSDSESSDSDDKKKKKSGKKVKKEIRDYNVTWNLPKDVILIFDEAHKCKNAKTTNSKLLQALVDTSARVLLLSATIADKEKTFEVCGYVLGLYKNLSDGKYWIQKIGKEYDNKMLGVHKALYPEHASRMKIKELGDKFPKNQVICECFDTDNCEEIEKQYEIIKEAQEALQNKEDQSESLKKLMLARMRVENIRIPIFIEQAKKFIEEGSSVCIFVNFNNTLDTLCKELNTDCCVRGDQTKEERDKHIENFQNDKQRKIILNIQSGGVGISLHDLNGKFPRVSLISPTWSGQNLLQCLGRIYRAGAKTPARQYICFCKNTVEEKICENVKEKIVNIANINDGEISGYKIDGLVGEDTLGIENTKELSDYEITFRKISNFNLKKDRLRKELDETEKELQNLNKILEDQLQKKEK